MLPVEKLQRVYHFLGQNENSKSIRFIPTLIITFTLCLIIDAIYYFVYHKNHSNNVEVKLFLLTNAARDINAMASVSMVSILYQIKHDVMKTMLSMINKKVSKFRNEISDVQKKLTLECISTQNKMLKTTGNVLIGCFMSVVIIPAAVTLLITLTRVKPIVIEDLPTPIVFKYPENYDTGKIYILVYIIQSIYIGNTCSLSYCGLGSISCAFQTIVFDTKILGAQMKSIDKFLATCKGDPVIMLKDYMRYLITCHQDIIRSVTLLNDQLTYLLSLTNQCMCFQICVLLFTTVEAKNIYDQSGFITVLLAYSFVVYVYFKDGQCIADAGEELKDDLYFCTWTDKPQWFKKDLNVMMSMASVPLEIKPHGVYIMNLEGFKSIMNFSYSYFNILRSVKQ